MRRQIQAVLFSSIVLLNGFACAQQNEGTQPRNTLYLAGTRQIVAVDLRTSTVKVWNILTLAGLKESSKCSAGKPPLSCDWYASQVRLDLKNGRIYFVGPAADPGTGSSSVETLERSSRGDAVWVLKLANMERVKSLKCRQSTEPPTIILTPDGTRLLVSYTDAESKQRVVDGFDTRTFGRISTAKDTSGNALNTYFPAGSYFLPNGKTIVVGDSRIWVESGRFKSEYVDHRSHLPAPDREKLQGFFTVAKDGQRLLKSSPAWSLGGKTLESTLNDSQTGAAFWTVDMETGATSPTVIVNFPARAALLGTGGRFAVFGAELIPQTGQRRSYFSYTGRVAIYDVKSGALAREFQIDGMKGEGRLLCSSEDGSLAAYSRGIELMILNLQTGDLTRLPKKLQDLPEPGYSGDCAFLSE